MKMLRLLLIFFTLPLALTASEVYSRSQQYPLEWYEYTTESYIYDIQSEKNSSLSELDLKRKVVDEARNSLAMQIQVKVEDNSIMSTLSSSLHSNGKESISTEVRFKQLSKQTTELELKFVETRTYYDPKTKEAYAIAYIEKNRASKYYENEYLRLVNAIENAFIIADNYAKTGYKERAKSELNSELDKLSQIKDVIFWLNIFGTPTEKLSQYILRTNQLEQKLKQSIADLQHSLTICLECKAQLSGANYPKLQNELKGAISKEGCSFTTDKTKADYVIIVEASNDEGIENVISGMKTYFTYISASIVIEKVATSQTIYEDELTAKGGHTRSVAEAAKAGYKELQKKLSTIITNNIKE